MQAISKEVNNSGCFFCHVKGISMTFFSRWKVVLSKSGREPKWENPLYFHMIDYQNSLPKRRERRVI